MKSAQKIGKHLGGYGAFRVMFYPTRGKFTAGISNSQWLEHHPTSPDHPGGG